MSDLEGLVCAFHIREGGSSEELPVEDIAEVPTGSEWTWLHFDRNPADTRKWLEQEGRIDQNAIDALLAEETRPRCTASVSGTLLILRGVNLNPNADPEDMIAIRVWIEPNRVVSVRRRRLMAVDAMRKSFSQGHGPKTIGDFVVALAGGLVDRMSGVLQEFEEEIDALEEQLDEGELEGLRANLIAARQKMIPLRRYLAPQRDALSQLISSRVTWLNEWQRGQIREELDRVTRFVEDLDAARERTSVIQDAITNQFAERTNKIMLLLSIVAAIFLPLSFVTGLLGINVGGIPGAEWVYAFGVVTGCLVVAALLELWLFRRLKWL